MVLRYNPDKWIKNENTSLGVENKSLHFPMDNYVLGLPNSPSSRIVKLHYNTRRGDSFEGLDLLVLSPSKSFHLYPSRSPTPPTLSGSQEVATLSHPPELNRGTSTNDTHKPTKTIELYASSHGQRIVPVPGIWGSGPSRANDGAKFHSQLKNGYSLADDFYQRDNVVNKKLNSMSQTETRTHKQALHSLADYKDAFETTTISQEELDDEWLLDLRIVANRLHFLKEAYKAVQSTRRAKFSKSNTNKQALINSSVGNSTVHLEDDILSSSQNQPLLMQNDEDYSSSNSNTDVPSTLANIILESR